MIKQAYALAITSFLSAGAIQAQTLGIQHLSTYESGIFDDGGSEIVAYDPLTQRVFSTNGSLNRIDILDVSNVNSPSLINSIALSSYGAGVNSVAVYNGVVAVAVEAAVKTDNGKVVFFDNQGNYLNQVTVGALPDMVAFSPNGNYVLTANEGEPNDAYTIDPEGTVSIIDMTAGAASLTQGDVTTVNFSAFNGQSIPGLRVFGPGATLAQDVEPEYVTFNAAGTEAYVILQENNGVATIDLATSTITSLKGLGFKDWSLFQLDASNTNPAIDFQSYSNLYGMYQPDAIKSVTYGSKTFIVTANEGDARDYAGFSEEDRVKDLTLDAAAFPNAAALQANNALGRLNVTNTLGDLDNDGDFDELYAYGARSFSIIDPVSGRLVYDSGDEIEMMIAQLQPNHFNSTNDDNTSFKNRSDDKGPEPEAIAVGEINGNTYAFIGMERQGGIMCFNITDTANVSFEFFLNNRNWNLAENAPGVGDLGPEDLKFVPASESPNGQNLLVMASEISGTVSIYQLNSVGASFSLSILHNNDGESQLINAGSGVEDFGGVARFKTLVDNLRTDAANNGRQSIMLSSGDNFLAGPEFSAGLNRANGSFYDAEALAAIDYDAICLGNHDFDFGPITLADFINDVNGINPTPYLSANLDFSTEPALSGLAANGDIAASTVVMKGGEMIGIVGATTPMLGNISSPGQVTINVDVVNAVQAEVDSLVAQGVNKIILISHLQDLAEDTAIVPQLRNVDVIIAGGGDNLLGDANTLLVPGDGPVEAPYPVVINDADNNPVYIVTTPGEYKYVGELKVVFDANGVITAVDSTSGIKRVAALNQTNGVAADANLQSSVVDSVSAYVASLAANIIATSEVALDGRRNSVRAIESNLGNLAADAMLWQANQNAAAFGAPQAQVGIQNGGGIRNNTIIPAGPFSELNTFDILPFANFVTIVEDITPARFKEFMENSVSALLGGQNSGSGRFAQVAGFSFVWDTSATSLAYDLNNNLLYAGDRVIEIKLDNGTYIVQNGVVVPGAPNVNMAIADFSAKGGDQYPLADLPRTQVGATYQQALFNYVTSANGLNGLIDSASYPEGGEGRITYYEPCNSFNLSAQNSGTYEVTFSWDNFSNTTPYRIYWRAMESSSWSFANAQNSSPSRTISNLAPGSYQMMVTLVDSSLVSCIDTFEVECADNIVYELNYFQAPELGRLGRARVFNIQGGKRLYDVILVNENGDSTLQINRRTSLFNNLGAGTYQLFVRDEYGCVSDSVASFTINPMDTAFIPNLINAPNQSPNGFRPTWNSVSGIINYQLRVLNVTDGTLESFISGINSTNYAVTNLTPGKLYRFNVRSRYKNGVQNVVSDYSNPVSRNLPLAGNKSSDASYTAEGASFQIYPNPAQSVVFVQATAGSLVQLIDLQGRQLAAQQAHSAEVSFDLSSLASGVYLIRVENAGEVATARLMVD